MEHKGLDGAATCKSKELDSVTLSSPLPGTEEPSRMHFSFKNLVLLMTYCICETFFTITTN